jgi:hypothetical protein
VIKETKKIHTGWKEFEKIKKIKPEIANKLTNHFGKYQYLFEKNKKIISMIELPNYMYDGKNRWEIYCMEGNLFDDVISFATEKEARARIKKILEKKNVRI